MKMKSDDDEERSPNLKIVCPPRSRHVMKQSNLNHTTARDQQISFDARIWGRGGEASIFN